MTGAGQPMVQKEIPAPRLAEDEVLVRVAGCGVCHTDLGFFYEGIRTVKSPPLTLGHEISGVVENAGANCREFIGTAVIVPAVLPCGECALCHKGRDAICRQQKMPGNHLDGGFASHVVVPGRYLCQVSVPDEFTDFGDSGVMLRELAVVADAVTTPYQAIKNSGLAKGELAVFIGIGGFGVQIAKALGATIVAIDIDERKLSLLSQFGADLTLNPKTLEKKAIRRALQDFVKEKSLSPFEWKIFET